MQRSPVTSAPAAAFRLFQPEKPVVALGLAVNYLMTKPAFAALRFGDWSRILVGQINRGHYYFVVDSDCQIQGFVGWALTSREKAEEWLEGRDSLAYEDSLDGECIVLNAWCANTTAVHHFVINEVRRMFLHKDSLYFKRYYKDGTVRPARLSVNDFVAAHIAREAPTSL